MPRGIAPGRIRLPLPDFSAQTFSPRPDRARGARDESRAPRSLRARCAADTLGRSSSCCQQLAASSYRRARRQASASARNAIDFYRIEGAGRRARTPRSHARRRRGRASSNPLRVYTCPSASASRALRADAGPDRTSSSNRAVRPARDSRSSRLCSSTAASGPASPDADEPEIAFRNLEAGNVAGSPRRKYLLLERAERTVASDRRTRRSPRTAAPDGARRRAEGTRRSIRDDERDNASRAAARRTTCR